MQHYTPVERILVLRDGDSGVALGAAAKKTAPMAAFTVGSLRGIPQGRFPTRAGSQRSPSMLGHEARRLELATTTGMPRARRCCRTGCAGCPWAEARRAMSMPIIGR